MKLYYYKERNFGDALNPWMWEKLLGDIFDDDQSIAFIGIGTLINDTYLEKTKQANLKIVFSSGVGYIKKKIKIKIDNSYKIYCLRGPLSTKALELSEELAVTDGGLLVNNLFKPSHQKVYKFSYMPHYELAGEAWNLACQELGFGYIDPRWSVEKVFSCLEQTEILLTEAMHGAIIADAFRIPWIPIVTNPSILSFKWQDWCASINVEYKPMYLQRLHHPRQSKDFLSSVRRVRDWMRQKKAIQELLHLTKIAYPTLSSDKKLLELSTELQSRLDRLKKDITSGIFNTTQNLDRGD